MRTENDLRCSGFVGQNCLISARAAMPYVHRPCRMGRSNPASAAMRGSMCMGFKSPFKR